MRKRTRKHRPQIKDLLSLKSLLPCHSVAERGAHFMLRAHERNFDFNLIPRMWEGMHWRPGDHGRWLVEFPIESENVLWSLTVGFDATDRPILITVCDRSLKALATQLSGSNSWSKVGIAALGGS